MKTKKLINDPADVVDEMIEGMLAAHPRHLRRAEGHRRALVAVEGPRTGKVGLVVGGGSGHEPTFAGLVGAGSPTPLRSATSLPRPRPIRSSPALQPRAASISEAVRRRACWRQSTAPRPPRAWWPGRAEPRGSASAPSATWTRAPPRRW